jgi:hypothetical protein
MFSAPRLSQFSRVSFGTGRKNAICGMSEKSYRKKVHYNANID